MRPSLAIPALLAAWTVVGCRTATSLNVSVDSEVGCNGATVALVGGGSLEALGMVSAQTVSSQCAAADGGEAAMGNVVIVPLSEDDESIAFAVMTRPDGESPTACLEAAQAPSCIVARRELRFIPHTALAMRVDLRLSCLGVICPGDETCVKGQCLAAQVNPGSCSASCDEGSLASTDAGTSERTVGGTLTGLATGDSLTLQDNGGDDLDLTANGPFTFATPLASGATYDVTISRGPTSPTTPSCVVTNGQGTVGSMDVTGVQVVCRTLTTLASGQLPTGVLALDATNVYFTNYGSGGMNSAGTLVKVPLGGGAATTLTAGLTFAGQGGIAVEGSNVYWTTQPVQRGPVTMMPVAGGMPVTIAGGLGRPASIRADATSVYWTNTVGNSVTKAPLQGGAITTLAAGEMAPDGLALDANNVYWSNYNTFSLQSAPVGGGATTTLATGQVAVWGIAATADDLYWTSTSNGTVVRMPLAGGAPVTLATGQSSPWGIAVDGTTVYWANNGGNAGAVVSMPVGGGAITTLASGQGVPYGVVLDATSIYWTNTAGGTVMKLTPR